MNHREPVELAARLCQHGRVLVERCEGVSPTALQRYWRTNKRRSNAWTGLLLSAGKTPRQPEQQPLVVWKSLLKMVFEEIATSGVLVRVASTVFRAIGEQLDVPLSIDVADRTVELHRRATEAAMACVVHRTDIPAGDLDALKQLGRLCDRITDLLCGALKINLHVDRYVVDAERAADFGATFGHRSTLVHVPVRMALRSFPASPLAHAHLAEEIERSLLDCLPMLRQMPLRHGVTELANPYKPRANRPHHLQDTAAKKLDESASPLSFPSLLFSGFLRKTGRDV